VATKELEEKKPPQTREEMIEVAKGKPLTIMIYVLSSFQ
jgi:hypothetical protein